MNILNIITINIISIIIILIIINIIIIIIILIIIIIDLIFNYSDLYFYRSTSAELAGTCRISPPTSCHWGQSPYLPRP